MKRTAYFLMVLVFVLSWHAPADATITTFNTFVNWRNALGGHAFFTERFDSFASDVQFRTQNVNVNGNFTLRQLDGPNGTPYTGPRNIIDATNDRANMFTDFGVTRVRMRFSTPVFAWGAFLGGLNDTGQEDLRLRLFLDMGGGFLQSFDITNAGFFGFVANPQVPVRRIIFQSLNNNVSGGESFTLKNVRGAFVPEPSTVILLGLGMLGLGVVSRRRKRISPDT